MILIIDNNDSFTYNIKELLQQTLLYGERIDIINNQDVNIEAVSQYDKIIFSPGPSLPNDYPVMTEVLDRYGDSKPILGICLGHQAICQYYGAKLHNLDSVLHGVESVINCQPDSRLFRGMRNISVGRYHSWVAVDIPPTELHITATDSDGQTMAVEHVSKAIYGVQFHPESYITKEGRAILFNFIYGTAQ